MSNISWVERQLQQRQIILLQLFYNFIDEEIMTLGKDYKLEENLDLYQKPDLVQEFLIILPRLLPKGHIFSILNSQHQVQAKSLYEVLLHAKDFDTFYKTLVWARLNLNEQLFVYTMSVTILHRPDCQGITLPPLYEIFPEYFFSSDIIRKVYEIKSLDFLNLDHIPNILVTDNSVVLDANYTGWYLKYNQEQKLSYFTEDIGLNLVNYNHHLNYPQWLGGEEMSLYKDRRGELHYYMHSQLLARYYLERLSNGLGEIPRLNLHSVPDAGYNPSLVYSNGMEYPMRPNNYNIKALQNLDLLSLADIGYLRILDSVDLGYAYKENGQLVSLKSPQAIDLLGNMLDGNPDSLHPRFYKDIVTMYKLLYGAAPKPLTGDDLIPAVTEHHQTSLRDPITYQIYAHLLQPLIKFKNNLPPYTRKELLSVGVSILSLKVDKLVTYFESFQTNITNLLHLHRIEAGRNLNEKAMLVRQERLNHKPYNLKLSVKSEFNKKVLIKVFLGPKLDSLGTEMPLDKNRINFLELSQMLYNLKQGDNIITMNSRENLCTSADLTSGYKLLKELELAVTGMWEFHRDPSESHNAFPERLLLPKGTKSGMPFLLYVHICDYVEPTVPYGKGSGAQYLTDLPLGYPLDRPLNEPTFLLPNMILKEVMIFHNDNTLNHSVCL